MLINLHLVRDDGLARPVIAVIMSPQLGLFTGHQVDRLRLLVAFDLVCLPLRLHIRALLVGLSLFGSSAVSDGTWAVSRSTYASVVCYLAGLVASAALM